MEAVAQAKVLAFAVEFVQVGKTAVVDFDHPVEQTFAECEGLALPVVGSLEHQVVACTGRGVSSEVELHTLMTLLAFVGVGQDRA